MQFFSVEMMYSLPFQEARKGVLFIDFPPVLQLQLKRFEYDFMRDTMVKVRIKNPSSCLLDMILMSGCRFCLFNMLSVSVQLVL